MTTDFITITSMVTAMTTPLLLITKDPSHPLAHLALRYAQALLEQAAIIKGDSQHASLKVFFYADAAHTANSLRWQSADQINLTEQWQHLAEQHNISLPVCVSTALSRGISDSDNSARHHLKSANLASGFELVGLSELALMMQSDCRLIQF